MPIYALGPLEPDIAASAFVHPDAVIIGQVRIGPEASVWPGEWVEGSVQSYLASARRYQAELRRLDPILPNDV